MTKRAKQTSKQERKRRHVWKIPNVLLVPGNDVCDHSVCDAWTDFFSQSDVAFQLLYSQSLLRVLLVLLLQLQEKKTMKRFLPPLLSSVCLYVSSVFVFSGI